SGRRGGHAGAPPRHPAGRGAAGRSRAEGPGAGRLRGGAARLRPRRASGEGVGAGPRPRVSAPPTRVPRPGAASGRDKQDRSRSAQGARTGNTITTALTRRVTHVHRTPDVRESRGGVGRGRRGSAG